jgi:hypothetical protein
MASPSTVITLGYGNGTLTGSPSLVITLGYGSSTEVIVAGPYCVCAADVFVAGAQAADTYHAGAVAAQGDCC